MSKTVDTKVVEMKFDNKNFEANVSQSMSTLEKLKKALKLDGIAEGFEKIDKASEKVNLDPLQRSCEKASEGFSGLEVVAVSALATITSQAIMAGERMIKALSVDQIIAGFNEYELKMGSVQTIMAATGADLSTVKGYLQELNEYADRTIYSFSDMTSNIGKFTNAGVKLDDAVLAMKGISNEAAVSGANAAEASRAMYNLSQALSMGYVQYIDWKSIENANMATVEFKQNLADAAVKLGTVQKAGEGVYKVGNQTYTLQSLFKDAMKDQWLTTDVLIDTLRDYADENTAIGKKAYAAAQDVKTWTQLVDTTKEAIGSGWAETFELIVGDFDEAKELFTRMSKAIDKMVSSISNARNKFIGDALSSNYTKLTTKLEDAGITATQLREKLQEIGSAKGISYDNIISEAGSFSKAMRTGKIDTDDLKNAINQLIGTGNNVDGELDELLEHMSELSGREMIIESLGIHFSNLGKIIGSVGAAFRNVFTFDSSNLNNLISRFYTFSNSIKITDEQTDKLRRTFAGLFSILHIVSTLASALLKIGLRILNSVLGKLGYEVLDLTAGIGDLLVKLDQWISHNKYLEKGIDVISDTIVKFINGVSNLIRAFKQTKPISDFGNIIKNLPDSIDKLLVSLGLVTKRSSEIGSGALTAANAMMGLNESITDSASTSPILNGIANGIKSISDIIQIFVGNGETFILTNISIAKVILLIMSIGIVGFIVKVTKAIKELLTPIKTLLSIGNTVSSVIKNVLKIVKNVNALINISKVALISASVFTLSLSILALAAAMKVIQSIPSEEIKKTITTVLSLCGAIVVMAGILTALNIASNLKGNVVNPINSISKQFIDIAISVGVIAIALEIITDAAKNKSFGIGLAALSALIIELAIVVGLLNYQSSRLKNFTSSSKIFGQVARSMVVMALALSILSKIPVGKLWSSVGVIIVLVAAITAIGILLGNIETKIKPISSSIITISIGMILLAYGIQKISDTLFTTYTFFKNMLSNLENIKEKIAAMGLTIGSIATLLGGIIASMTLIGKNGGLKASIKMGSSIFGLGVGIIALVYAIKIMKKLMSEKPIDTLKAMGGVLVSLMALIILLNKMPIFRDKKKKDVFGTLLGIGLCGVLMSVSFAIINETSKDVKMGKIALIFAGLAALILSISFITKTSSKIKHASSTLIGLGICISIIAVCFDKLVKINASTRDVLEAVGILAGIFIGIFAVIKAIGSVGKFGKRTAATLISIAIIIGVISTVISALSDTINSNPASALAAIVVIGVVLFALVKSLQTLSSLSKISISAIGAIVALGVIISAMTLALTLLSKNDWGSILVSCLGMATVIAALSLVMPTLGEIGSISPLAIAAVIALGTIIVAMSLAFGQLAKNDWNTILTATLGMAAVIVALGFALGRLSGLKAMTITGIGTIVAVGIIVSLMAVAFRLLAKQGWGSILTATLGMAAVIVAMSIALDLIAGLSGMTMSGMITMAMVGGVISIMALAFGELAKQDWGSIVAACIGMTIVLAAMTIALVVLSEASGPAAIAGAAMIELGVALLLIAGAAVLFSIALDNILTGLVNFIQGIKDVFGIHSPSKVFEEIGDFIMQGFVNGITGMFDSVVGFFGDLGKRIFDTVTGWFNGLKEKGKEIIKKVGEGISDAKTFVVDKAKAVGDAIKNKMGEFKDKLKEVGGNMMDGLKNGITGAAENVKNAVAGVANSAVDKFKSLLGIHSPSRVFAGFGENISQGLANGINKVKSKVTEAIGGVGEDIKGTMQSYMGDITSSMEDFKPEFDTSEVEQQMADLQNSAAFDYQPTITPVFDGSEVYAGIGDINSQFASQSYDLAATANFDYDKSLFDKFEANQNGLNVNNSDVVSAISSLNNRMDQMAQAISNLQIVMDTGTLVGSIAEPMDNALGQRMVFAGRGI